MPDLRPRSCRSKNVYTTVAMANQAARRYRDRYGWLYDAYQCRHCDGWHIHRRKIRGNYVPYLTLKEDREGTTDD